MAGRAYRQGEDFAAALANCLIRPARLPAVLHEAAARRPEAIFEAGPGGALARNAHRVLAEHDIAIRAPLSDCAFKW